MKSKFTIGLIIAVTLFIALFAIRLLYGYQTYPNGKQIEDQYYSYNSSDFGYGKKNYASKKYVAKNQATSVNQKYEKIGSLQCKSSAFDKDEKRLRELISSYKSLIQFEQKFGLKKKRTLKLAIGVLPQKFDSFIAEIKKIKKLTYIQIDKLDKTNEYLAIQAQKKSLEKILKSLTELKQRKGRISELIALENRILQIEEQIQATGMKLGEFDKENEFCTVKVTLVEKHMHTQYISLLHRAKVAFEWTSKYYISTVFALLVGVIVIYILLILSPKLRVLYHNILKLIQEQMKQVN